MTNKHKLPPGRELDKLVAKEVMQDYIFRYFEDYFDPKPYSTDIKAAWEVVEKMALLNVYYLHEYNNEFEKFWAIAEGSGMDYYIVAQGESAPHAICLAALALLDEENK